VGLGPSGQGLAQGCSAGSADDTAGMTAAATAAAVPDGNLAFVQFHHDLHAHVPRMARGRHDFNRPWRTTAARLRGANLGAMLG
jgi:hypothetical protein